MALDLVRLLRVVDDVPAHAAGLGRADVGARAELGDGQGLAPAQVAAQLLYIVRVLGEIRVVVDADEVEEVPVDGFELLVLGGGVAEAAVEDGAADGRRLRGEAGQAALHPRHVDVALLEVLDAVQDRLTGDDPRHEQPELAAHAEVDARALPPQPLREPPALGDALQDLPLGYVPEGRLEPDVQPALGGLGGGGDEALDAVAGDVEGVGVQVVADDPDVRTHPRGAPRGTGRLSRADGVDDAPVPQSLAPRPAALRLPFGGRGLPRGQHRPRHSDGRRPRQKPCPADPRGLLHTVHTATVASTGPYRRPPMVYGAATKE